MTTRLTKDIRTEILDSVIASTDLPARKKAIETATSELAAQCCRDAQPPGFNELIAGQPKGWFQLDSSVNLANDHSPLTPLYEADEFWRGRKVDYPDPIPVAHPLHMAPLEEAEVFGPLRAQADAWRKEHDEIVGELRAFLNSCRTVEQVIERMPELKRHVPAASAPSFPLVAPSNVLSRLTKLGFDRGVSQS